MASLTLQSLTPNAISRMVDLRSSSADATFHPTLQILNIKSLGSDRFRAVMSDGTHYIQGMLGGQLNHLVVENQLKTNAVVQVRGFMTNFIAEKLVVIVLDMTIQGFPETRLGDPKKLEVGAAPAGQPAPPTSTPMYNQNQNQNNRPSSSGSNNPYASPANSRGSRPNGGSAPPIVPRQTSPGGSPITPIAQLNMYQNKWTIKARVVSKSDVKTWSNNRGEGSLFSIELLDASGMDVRATLFKEAVDKYYNFLQVGSVYTVSGGRIKVANIQYNTCKSDHELTLDQNSEIHLVDDEGDISAQCYDFVKIRDVEQVEEGKNVDILGVVQEVGDPQSLISKKSGTELNKADVTLVDETGVQIRLTLWGNSALNAKRDIELHKVAAFRRCRVSDYGGKSLSGSNGVTMEPKIPETAALQQWWTSHGSNGGVVKSLSTGGGGAGGRADAFGDRQNIAVIKGKNMGYGSEKGDYLSFRAAFVFIKRDKEGGAWYTACPNKDEPCRNRCKVNQTTDGNWQCDRCSGTFSECNRKWIFSANVNDDYGATWVSIFDDQALTMFGGTTADEAFANYDNQDFYDSIFAKANFTEWVMKCRVKNETHNGEDRIKTQVVRMDPIDHVAEGREMYNCLEKWGL